ncbi:MAG TPA: glycosyltransferase family A protein [Solirubrobacteraceae bacterium]|nr:glycosyltransferase family A protein [Solirubrobacteraceae bacterium]
MAGPRVVIGAPLYGQSEHLREALGSLLAQTYRDFRLVLVDDRSPDDTVAVARAVAGEDPRVEIHVNLRRLGMLQNTNRAWALSRERHPGAEFWALGSDHDVWAPEWLERLVAALDASPRAVLAYPRTQRIDAAGRVVRGSWRFSTAGMEDPRRRLHHCLRRMVSGDMIYGLFRSAPLDRLGFYRPVLAPDRLLLSELALEGEFVQVPELLWSRRHVGLASLDRQRRAFWPDSSPPAAARVPWWIAHTRDVARRHGTVFAARHYAPPSLAFQVTSRAHRVVGAAVVPPVRAAIRTPAGRRVVRAAVLPAVRASREVLERLSEEDAEAPR